MKTPSMYEQAMGAEFLKLPLQVQRFHQLAGQMELHGQVEMHAPASKLALALAYLLGAPRAANSGPIRFELDAGPQSECWVRHFPSHTMTSTMSLAQGMVEEKLGAARLTFELIAEGNVLHMRLVRMRFLGLPCPSWLMPHVIAQEHGCDNKIHFRVAAALPLIGTVASYRGHLDLGEEAPL